ncbi:MAG TPA: FAD-dependent oxidoreductase [Thermodesulfovibrionales bacterium]|nr:FAD-dependent oxidoreductase [Thermodesulfovibrionales bacterium]
MTAHDFDIGILGGGAAGLTIASGAARLGAKTLLIERDGRLGGDCLYFGCVPSKTLIKTAQVWHMSHKTKQFGLPELDCTPVDFRAVSSRIQSVISTIQKHDSVERFCSLGVKVEFGNALFIDDHSVKLNGKTYSSRTWVIATGSSPSIPPIKGLDKTPFITNRELFSLDHLPRSMIFLGGGPVSTEMAQAFNRLGSKVTIIERGNHILGREDKDMADVVMDVLEKEGITFHLNASVLSVRDLGAEKEMIINKGEESTGIRAESLVVAAGRKANIGGIGLEEVGIEFDGRGLIVDSRMRTNLKHIYAAGDVTGAYQFTHAAGYEGSIVVSNAIFHLPRRADYALFPWCTYTDPELASIGMNETAAKTKGIVYSVWTEEFKANDRSLAEGEEVGRIKMILDQHERPIGIQIMGPHAGDLLNEWVAVLNGRVKLSTLATAVHPYPTLGEINKKVAGTYLSGKIFSDKVRKALTFFFSLKGRACG